MEEYRKWLDDPAIDAATKDELRAIDGDDAEIKERFYKDLEFGTGGLRGIMGAGSNRMNVYTVRKATQGLANYILKQGGNARDMGVVIAHDCRRMSPEFCEEAALVLNGNGIRAYVFDSLRPTPVLSFAVRYLNATAGIVITASHNPPEYNGYKAYWADGGQTPYPRDEEIMTEVYKVTDFSQIKRAEGKREGMYIVAGHDVDDAFAREVEKQSIHPEIIADSPVKIVYTPLHGTGNLPVRRVLADMGFQNVSVVKKQELPDGNFPTVDYPNPEDPKAFELALELAREEAADIVIATDPDADRMGLAVRNRAGEYEYLTGNMTGVILEEYIMSQRKAAGTLPEKPAVVSTIVSTRLAEHIAKAYGAAYYDVLTGFKYIGEKIKEFEAAGEPEFVYGFEESFGCLAGTHARDKDSVVAALLACEAAAYYASKNMTLLDALDAVHKKYGYYEELNESIIMKGVEGQEKIQEIMERLRENPLREVCGRKVVEDRDYLRRIIRRCGGGTEATTLPVSDVLYYMLEDGSWFCVRPSGTEPKVKIYYGVKAPREQAKNVLEEMRAEVKAVMLG